MTPEGPATTCVRDDTGAIRIAESDTVAVALRDLEAGEELECGGALISMQDAIPAHHKFALVSHAPGDLVLRFGHPIGKASTPIAPGQHVHTHNLVTALSGTLEYDFRETAPAKMRAARPEMTFRGYRRPDGRVGTRNDIWIVATVGCVANVCEQIACRAERLVQGQVDNVIAITHPHGCSQLGGDLQGTREILAALARHPNAGGVVLVGLGCESNQADALIAAADGIDRSRLRHIQSQHAVDEISDGVAAVQELAEIAGQDMRTECGLSDLVVGLKCGGSDALSGLTANPLLGDVADAVTENGGRAILTEIPEIFGAEQLLMKRAASRVVFDAIAGLVNDFKDYFLTNNQPVYENPSPGNKAGGITTLEEKSLGAVQKAGSATVTDVLRYGERVRKEGLSLLESPGNDAVSCTALAAAGANLILFTTGRGTPLGFPVPTVKVSSNSMLAERKPGWIDFDAGPALNGMPRAELAETFLAELMALAGGQQTCNERNFEHSIAIWKRGVTL